MCKSKVRRWLGTSALGSVLIVGCHHAGPSCGCPAVNNPAPATASTPAGAGQKGINKPVQGGVPATTSATPSTATPIESYRQVDPTIVNGGTASPAPSVDRLPGYSGTPLPQTAGQGAVPVANPISAAPATTTSVNPAEPTATTGTPSGLPTILTSLDQKPAPGAATEPAHKEAAPEPVAKPPAPEAPPAAPKSAVTSAANPGYAHAADYAWLTGELQTVHFHNTTSWRLRYAGLDEEDRYGGAVTLLEVGDMANFQNGQFVRVEGKLADSNPREGAVYRVGSIHALTSP